MDIQPYTSEDTLALGRPWLLSVHGLDTNTTITLDLASFAENTHWLPATPLVPERRLKSGLPLGRITESGLYGLYDSAATDGRQTFAGLLATETAYNPASTRAGGALLIHGQVDPTKLPIDFTVPAAASRTDAIIFKA